MNYVIVLAGHGMPPSDFPKQEAGELFSLHGRIEAAEGAEKEELIKRHDELHLKMRLWKRTPENDPFHFSTLKIAEHLNVLLNAPLFVGYNEFCTPSVEEAIDEAVNMHADRVIIFTPMLTSGGVHAEVDIPRSPEKAREKYPDIPIVYAWPFEVSLVAEFLASHNRGGDWKEL